MGVDEAGKENDFAEVDFFVALKGGRRLGARPYPCDAPAFHADDAIFNRRPGDRNHRSSAQSHGYKIKS